MRLKKETFLLPGHPLFAKFVRLTQQEMQHGLLADTATIGTRDGWQERLRQTDLVLRGYRLFRRKTSDRADGDGHS